MKLTDIQPHATYAYYAANQRYGSPSKVYFHPQQLIPSMKKGKVWGYVWSLNWYNRTHYWKKELLSLNMVQKLFPIYEQEERERRERLAIEREEDKRFREENQKKADELFSYLKQNKEALEAAGLPIPAWFWGWDCTAGEIKLSFTQSQLEALLAKLSK